jgi:hypothetical protein
MMGNEEKSNIVMVWVLIVVGILWLIGWAKR